MQFTLKINLGNEVMQDPSDVAQALDRVAGKLARRGNFFDPDEGGVVLDDNGNTVGNWYLTEGD